MAPIEMDPDEAARLPVSMPVDPATLTPQAHGGALATGSAVGRVYSPQAKQARVMRREAAEGLARALEVQAKVARGEAVIIVVPSRRGAKGEDETGGEVEARTRVLVPTLADMSRATSLLRSVAMDAALTAPELRHRMHQQVKAIGAWADRYAVPQEQVDDLLSRLTQAWA